MQTRRQLLLAAAAGTLLPARQSQTSRLTVEAYIFQQYAKRQGKALGDVLPQVISMAALAGFKNIELNSEFLGPELRARTLELIRHNHLAMPSVYNGGPMHESELARRTMERTLDIGRVCQPFGCVAVVFNADPKGNGQEKTDGELASQSEEFNQLGRLLSQNGLQLRIHNHTPEMARDAREWRYTLRNTDPAYVSLCLDLDWVWQSGQDPLALLKEAGSRVSEIHVRSSNSKLWSEALGFGDIDYRRVAEYLRSRPLTL